MWSALIFAASVAGCADTGETATASTGSLSRDYCIDDANIEALYDRAYATRARVVNASFEEVSHECATDCLFAEDPVTCTTNCIDEGTSSAASYECAGCYAQFELCVIRNCSLPCSRDEDSVECFECRGGHNSAGQDCSLEWQRCSGM